ncbi:DNA-binding protein [Azospirillaceae bacterium]
MAVSDDVKKRFAEYIKLQVFDEKYISREKEKKILGEAVMRFEIGIDDSRAIMSSVAAVNDFIFERDVDRLVKEIMQAFASLDRYISRKEFYHAANIYRQLSGGYIGEGEARRRLKQMMVENDWKPRRDNIIMPPRWYMMISEK